MEKTSTAALANFPLVRTDARAVSSIIPPLEVLTIIAPFF
jgi:hypothetical protein